VQAANRTETVVELREQLSLTPTVSALVDEVEEDMERKDSARNKEAKKKSSGGNLWLIFGGCLLALALVAVIVLAALGRLGGGDEDDVSQPATTLPSYTITTRPTKEDGKIVVDNVVGLNYYDLRDATLSGNMEVGIDHFEFSDKAAGTILSQEPAASAEVEPGTQLKVVISYGRQDETVQVPNVRGWEQEHAKLYLEALGFRVQILQLQSSDVAKGLVDGTDPKAGTEKRLGDTITLRVSNVETTTTASTTASTTTSTLPHEKDPSEDESDVSDTSGDNSGDENGDNSDNSDTGDDETAE